MVRAGLVLDGWDEIQGHLEVISGVHRSIRTLQRWAEKEQNPLPVYDSPGGGPLADAGKLEAWWERHRFTY